MIFKNLLLGGFLLISFLGESKTLENKIKELNGKNNMNAGTDRLTDKTLESKIVNSNGSPTLFINGKPQLFMVYRDHNPNAHIDTVKRFSQSGVSLTTFAVNLSGHTEDMKGVYNWVDSHISSILKEAPDLYFLIIVSTAIKNKSKWYKEHPQDATIWPPGTISDEMAQGDRISQASKHWKQVISEKLYEFVKHVAESKYSNRVVGYVLTGPPGEWTDWYDFSKPALDAYKEWLKKKYGTLNALRDSWQDKSATFENVEFPEWNSFSEGDMGIFFDPVKSRKKIDFWEYHHGLPKDAISLFCEKVKKASGNKCIVGLYHGYLTDVEWDGNEEEPYKIGYFRMRHKSLPEILKDPNVDFMISPYGYQERHAGGVFDYSLVPDSMILNGKMAFIEDDTRTHLVTQHPAYSECEELGDNFGRAQNAEETLGILKRNFAAIYTKCGSGSWFLGLGNDGNKWWDDPQILDCIGVLKKTAEENLLNKDKNVSEIAVIGSYRSVFFQKFNNLPKEFITRQLVENLYRVGAPFDMYLDSDLSNPDFPFEKYKLFIFLNNFYLNDSDKKLIKEKICANNKTVVWIYATGIVDDKSLSIKNVESLTGIKLSGADVSIGGIRCGINNYTSSVTKYLPKNFRYGPDKDTRALSPVIWNADPEVETLGELLATTSKKPFLTFRKPGLCIKKFKNWTSIWSPVPNLPSALLREIARYAGVHIYCEGAEQVLASRKLLAVHVGYDGTRTIKLPRKYDVYDPFKKTCIARKSCKFEAALKKGETGFWILKESVE